MTDYPKALAAARDALARLREHDGGTRYNGDDDDAGERACCLVASWKPHDSDCPHAVAVADFENLLAALDAARGEAVAWQVTVVDNTGTHDYAKWAGLQAPPAAAVSASGHFEVLRELSATLIGRSQERHAAIEWALERIEAQPAAAVPAANVTPMRQPRADLARLVESINAAVYANGDGLSVTEAIGALELAKLELLKEQEQ